MIFSVTQMAEICKNLNVQLLKISRIETEFLKTLLGEILISILVILKSCKFKKLYER